jgi:exodeoxyribonuclease VII large subunit
MASLITPTTTNTVASRAVKDVYAVSRLVREARVTLEGSFPLIWVEGEISNLAMPASGHVYFTLKDEIAQVRCAMFRSRNRQLRFTPKNGLQVLIRARVTLYEGRGEFQLAVEHMEEAGSGALQRAYEALKFRLGDEGLFDQAHKKNLPLLPTAIGIISSPNGAALHDILTVLKRRCSSIRVIIYPVSVQGSDSVMQITQAIKLADQRKECDVLIVGRGGGSIEDLWSFNDEKVARAMYQCTLPIISAVGHEVDFTIADFVADIRAATPSAAAEIAAPDAQELRNNVEELQQRMTRRLQHTIQSAEHHIGYLEKRLPKPQQMIEQQIQRLDRAEQQLSRSWKRIYAEKQQVLTYNVMRLKHPQAKIETQQYRVSQLQSRLNRAISAHLVQRQHQQAALNSRFNVLSPLTKLIDQHILMSTTRKQLNDAISRRLSERKEALTLQMRTLRAVSPLNTLERGYSITTLVDSQQVVRSSQDVTINQHINVRLNSGELQCEIKEVKHD